MLTRRSTLETQLKATLQELKTTKELCNKLLLERDEGEVEVKQILDKNSALKCQLAELHSQYTELLNQRDHLQSVVQSLDNYSATYEQALNHISELEHNLNLANTRIDELQQQSECVEAEKTQSLFEELVDAGHTSTSVQCGTCVCGVHNTQNINKNFNLISRNRVKKYIKINRFIERSKRAISGLKKFNKYISTVEERA